MEISTEELAQYAHELHKERDHLIMKIGKLCAVLNEPYYSPDGVLDAAINKFRQYREAIEKRDRDISGLIASKEAQAEEIAALRIQLAAATMTSSEAQPESGVR